MAFGSKINLSATGWYGGSNQGCGATTFSAATKSGRRWWYYTTGAACSEVEVDLLTGEHRLLSTEIVMDVGKAINPAIDIAQIEAAFIQVLYYKYRYTTT